MSQSDFDKLCRSIEDAVVGISDIVENGINTAGDAIGSALQQAKDRSSAQNAPAANGKPDSRRASAPGSAPQVSWNDVRQTITGATVNFTRQLQQQAQTGMAKRRQTELMKRRFKSGGGLIASGTLMTVFGGMFTLGSFATMMGALMTPMSWVAFVPVMVTLGVLAVGFGLLTGFGIRRIVLGSRFNDLKRFVGLADTVPLRDLARRLQMTDAKTLSFVRTVLKIGLLPEGRLDDAQSTLILSNEAYAQYRAAQDAYLQRQREELAEQQRLRQERDAALQEASGLPAPAREFVAGGEGFVERLRELDRDIDDEQVSERIVAIEDVVGRILARVKEEPSVVSGLNKLMDYYLPTTVKLLSAYDSLEHEAIEGENINKSRREIEKTLDVLLGAYEKLLDETYQNMSMDVTSDITVLHAVLAQEGLIESPFDRTSGDADGEAR